MPISRELREIFQFYKRSSEVYIIIESDMMSIAFNSIRDLLDIVRALEEISRNPAFNSIRDLLNILKNVSNITSFIFQFYKRSSQENEKTKHYEYVIDFQFYKRSSQYPNHDITNILIVLLSIL